MRLINNELGTDHKLGKQATSKTPVKNYADLWLRNSVEGTVQKEHISAIKKKEVGDRSNTTQISYDLEIVSKGLCKKLRLQGT